MTRPAVSRRSRPWLLLVLAASCQKNAAESSAPGGDAGAAAEPASLESLEAELHARKQELSAATTAQRPTPADTMEPQQTRCERVCEIREAICSLSDAICGLADEHPGEARYASACETARADCADASEVCDACED